MLILLMVEKVAECTAVDFKTPNWQNWSEFQWVELDTVVYNPRMRSISLRHCQSQRKRLRQWTNHFFFFWLH